jgi:hypothetical protein
MLFKRIQRLLVSLLHLGQRQCGQDQAEYHDIKLALYAIYRYCCKLAYTAE